MEVKQHHIKFFCPECKVECSIHYIEANSVGEIDFYYACKDCCGAGIGYVFKSSMAIIKRFCRDADSECEQPEVKPVLSPEDVQWLREMNITDAA